MNFRCNDCGNEFEELVLGSDPAVVCRKCHSNKIEKLMSAVSFRAAAVSLLPRAHPVVQAVPERIAAHAMNSPFIY